MTQICVAERANITVIFEGLLLLRFLGKEICEVAACLDDKHKLTIEIKAEPRQCDLGEDFKKLKDELDTVGKPGGKEGKPKTLDTDLWIAMSPSQGVHRHGDPHFDRKTCSDSSDFGWAPHMSGLEFHKRDLSLNPKGHHGGKIYLADGNFYTSKLSGQNQYIDKTNAVETVKNIGSVARQLVSYIRLAGDESVATIGYGAKRYVVKRGQDVRIWIRNLEETAKEGQFTEQDCIDRSHESDFKKLYNAIQGVPPWEQYALTSRRKDVVTRSIGIPCSPGVI